MTPRQPSVPKRIVVHGRKQYMRSGWRLAKGSELEQFLQTMRFQPLHHAADVLGAVARADQQSVGRFHDDQIANAHGGDEFCGTPEEIARGVEREEAAGGDVFARHRLASSS